MPARADTLAGNGTQDDPYQIYTADDLRKYADIINGTGTETVRNPYACAKLMKNIDLNPNYRYDQENDQWTDNDGRVVGEEKLEQWTPIGKAALVAHTFAGTFDGNGKTIYDLYINSSDDYQGLFGYLIALDDSGTVKNLTVSGSITVEGDDVGGIAGYVEGNCMIINCTNMCTVTAKADKAKVGGVVGYNFKGTVTGCTNSGDISAIGTSSNAGGVAGNNNGPGTIKNCTNTGNVDGTIAGGVLGENSLGYVISCRSTGNVTGTTVGGVVGNNPLGEVNSCYNKGTVTGITAGGVVGVNAESSTNSAVYRCYNTGIVTGSTTAGGVVGVNAESSTAEISDCYFLKVNGLSGIGETGSTNVKNVEPKTTEEFASGEVAWLLQDALGENADQAWGQKLSGETPDEYPVLTSDTSKKVYQVTFKDSGSTFATDYANSGDTATKPTDPTQTGYTFGGWYSDESLTDDWYFDTNTVTDDITLHAKWTVCTYTVTFDTNSGTINSGNITEYTYGEGAKLPTDVTRPGYTFGGWYENSNFSGEPVKEISKTDTGNKTYYAKWLSANAGVSSVTMNGVTATLNDTTFTVTLPAGSSLPTADEIQIIPATGADITAGPTTNDGGANWTFTVTAEDGTTTATYTIQVTIALQPTYTVTVSANPAEGGTVSGGGEATEGTEVTVTATPASGYHFVRWTENDTTVSTDTSYTFNLEANRTLVAIFEQDQTPTPDPDPDDPPYNGKYSYEIVSDVGENGTIDVDRYATEGDQVTITVSPDEAYLLDDLTVTSGGKDVALTDNGDGTYTFTMPSGDVAVTATFAEDPNWEEPEDPATDVSEIFTDVPANHWAQAALQYVYDNGLMTGISDTAFAPEATTTRAMIVSMLARMENVTSAADAGFADVAADDWYATAVNWAAANGIVNGISDDTFAPNTAITREQLAAMLMNYAQWKGQDTSARADLSGYSDAPSTWASEAVQWAVAEGLLAGVTDDELQPQGQATRAQVAAIMQRFLEA